ncbi:MAG: hypothetical protein V3R68_06955 [Gammaproteobacteria bacterium]
MIHLICALKCEGRPLIQQYGLKQHGNAGRMTTYVSNKNDLSLTITGTGKDNAAVGTGYAHDRFKARSQDAWLNIGIAGHASIDVGQAVLAHRIQDSGSDRVWYPQIVFEPPCRTAELLTLDTPYNNYADKLYDMEAAGFYMAASRYAGTKLIHSLKIISDNAAHPVHDHAASFVEGLIRDRLEIVDCLLNELRSISSGPEAVPEMPGWRG